MAKFREKPIVIEAVQLLWDTWSEMCDHAGVGRLKDGKPQGAMGAENSIALDIPTSSGLVHVEENDWVIKNAQGELSVCGPDIFEATYEEMEEIP